MRRLIIRLLNWLNYEPPAIIPVESDKTFTGTLVLLGDIDNELDWIEFRISLSDMPSSTLYTPNVIIGWLPDTLKDMNFHYILLIPWDEQDNSSKPGWVGSSFVFDIKTRYCELQRSKFAYESAPVGINSTTTQCGTKK